MRPGEVLINILTKGDPKGAERVTNSLKQLEERAIAVGKSLSLRLTAPITAAFGVSIAAYGQQEKAEIELAAALRATGQEVDRNIEKLKSQAAAIQAVTTVGDEQSLGLAATATQMGVQADQMDEVIRGAIGLSRAFDMDLKTAVRGAAAAVQGKTELLTRYIPMLSEVESEGEKVAMVQEAMVSGFAQAEAEGQTTFGAMGQLKNSFGDLTEEIGAQLVPILKPLLEGLKNLVAGFSDTSDGAKQTLVILGLLAASAGPLALMVGLGAKATGAMIGLGRAIKGVGAAASFLKLTPIGVGLGIIALLLPSVVSGFSDLNEEMEQTTRTAEDVEREIERVTGKIEKLGDTGRDVSKKSQLKRELASLEKELVQIENPLKVATDRLAELESKLDRTTNTRQKRLLESQIEEQNKLISALEEQATASQQAAAEVEKLGDTTETTAEQTKGGTGALGEYIAGLRELTTNLENAVNAGNALADYQRETARLNAIAAGDDEEAKRLEREQDLINEKNRLRAMGLEDEEAITALAKERLEAEQRAEENAKNRTSEIATQNAELREQISLMEKLAEESGGRTQQYRDAAGRVQTRAFDASGNIIGDTAEGETARGLREGLQETRDRIAGRDPNAAESEEPADPTSVPGAEGLPDASGESSSGSGGLSGSEAAGEISESVAELVASIEAIKEETIAGFAEVGEAQNSYGNAVANQLSNLSQQIADLASQLASSQN